MFIRQNNVFEILLSYLACAPVLVVLSCVAACVYALYSLMY